jgi:release factor glutamine methyltransferase
MKRIRDLLESTTAFLNEKAFPHARHSAEQILSTGLGKTRLELYCNLDQPLTNDELASCRAILKRRLNREPIQYIEGEVEFAGCKIQVNRSVLIPRPETEQLVEKIDVESGRLLDLCCGSGCIGIALKKRHPQLQVTLSDISPEALSTARRNAERNNVEVTFLQGDLCATLADRQFDAVICNPPYIRDDDYATLEPEVRDWEPKNALVGGPDGLDFFRRLKQDLPPHLAPGAKVWFEMHGTGIQEVFPEGKILEDWSGRPRFLYFEIGVQSVPV